MGTPEFAVPSLEALIAAGHTVCGVFSQPDRPKGRGMRVVPTPVKACAQAHQLPVYQPERLKDSTALELLHTLAPDLIVVAAYGRILPDELLEVPPLGCINVHSSLLPRYRGAAPIHWAILNGDTETGVTIMEMVHDLDAGDIIDQVYTQIGPDETSEDLSRRLAQMGASLLVQVVEQLAQGSAKRTPQDQTLVTLAPMLTKKLSHMDWTRTAHELHNQVRGLLPWPAASTDVISGDLVKIFRTAETGEQTDAIPGTIVASGKQGIDIACGDKKILRILELQPIGGKRMNSAAYLLGHPLAP